MAFLHSFAIGDFLDSLVSLTAAFILGTLIGAERQYRQRGGGLRTHVLVAVGAATFVDIGQHLNGNAGATQIIAYVVSGVGFLGAGVIMKQGSNVWGLNTAATLWCSAAVGACAGADLAFEAVALTCFVLAGNTLLRPLVNAINRAPIDEGATEVIYEVLVTTTHDNLDDGRELLREQLTIRSATSRLPSGKAAGRNWSRRCLAQRLIQKSLMTLSRVSRRAISSRARAGTFGLTNKSQGAREQS
jgi:putative Mg2+ transporter-C (MgtC) family protein